MDFQGLMYRRVFCTGSSRPPPVMLVACRGTTLLVLGSVGGAGGLLCSQLEGPDVRSSSGRAMLCNLLWFEALRPLLVFSPPLFFGIS